MGIPTLLPLQEIGSVIYTRSIINDYQHTLEISDHFTTGEITLTEVNGAGAI